MYDDPKACCSLGSAWLCPWPEINCICIPGLRKTLFGIFLSFSVAQRIIIFFVFAFMLNFVNILDSQKYSSLTLSVECWAVGYLIIRKNSTCSSWENTQKNDDLWPIYSYNWFKYVLPLKAIQFFHLNIG